MLHVLMDGGFLFFGGDGMPCVGTLACFALIRRWRDTFPTRGKASFGGAGLYVVPLSNGDPGAPPGGRGSTARRCLVVAFALKPGVPLRSG